jgi:hypothetical protein
MEIIMADKTSTTANKMRLADKVKKLRDGIRMHTYNERTEDKGGDVDVTEVEHNGQVVGRYVQHDGVLTESSASEDAQATGLHAEVAKKLGAGDQIVHTKPEDVSIVANEMQRDSVKNKDNQKTQKPEGEAKLDNCWQAEKAKTPAKGGKEVKAEKLDKAVTPPTKPKAPEAPKTNVIDYKKLTPAPPAKPNWKVKSEARKEAKRETTPGAYKAKSGTWMVKSTDELKKKWSVIMDSMGKFRDPLSKAASIISIEEFRARKRRLDLLDRANQPNYEPGQEPNDRSGSGPFQNAISKQRQSLSRQAAGRQIPLPVDDQGQTKANVLPPETLTSKLPEPAFSMDLNDDPVKKAEFDPKAFNPLLLQSYPTAENGLESLLSHLQQLEHFHGMALTSASQKDFYHNLSAIDRNKAMAKAARALKYLKRGIEMTKLSIATRDSAKPDWGDLIGKHNAKVNQLGAFSFANTLPGFNCPGRGDCGDGFCYGMNGNQNMPGAIALRGRNSGLIHRDDFAEGAIHALKTAPKMMTVEIDPDMFDANRDLPLFKHVLEGKPELVEKMNNKTGKPYKVVRFRVRAGDTIRWHDTGDIINQKHVQDMETIMSKFPEKKFYAYSKSLHLNLDGPRGLQNFNLIQSVGGKHDDKIDLSKPHTRYFADPDQPEKEGYHSVYMSDHPAIMGETNIALTPHGGGRKKLDVDTTNKILDDKGAPIDTSKLNKSIEITSVPNWVKHDQPDVVSQCMAGGAHGKLRGLHVMMQSTDQPLQKSDEADAIEKEKLEKAYRRYKSSPRSGSTPGGHYTARGHWKEWDEPSEAEMARSRARRAAEEKAKTKAEADKPKTEEPAKENLEKGEIVKFGAPKAPAKPTTPEPQAKIVSIDSKPEAGVQTRAQKLMAAMKAHGTQGGSDFARDEKRINKIKANNTIKMHTADKPGVVKPEFKAPAEPEVQSRESRVKGSLARIEQLRTELRNKSVDSAPATGSPRSGIAKLAAAMDKKKKTKKEPVKKSEQLPGGMASGKSFKDFSLAEKFAIMRGSQMESKEHGSAGSEIASDHVVEHGKEYYGNKGLPKLEGELSKSDNLPPSFEEKGPSVETAEEAHALSLQHGQAAQRFASAGAKGEAARHHKEAAAFFAHAGKLAKPVKKTEELGKAKPATYDELKNNPVPAPHGTIQNLDAHQALSMAQKHHAVAQQHKAAGRLDSSKYHADQAEAYLKQHQQLRDGLGKADPVPTATPSWSGQAGSGATNSIDAAAQNAAAGAGKAVADVGSKIGNFFTGGDQFAAGR